MYMYCIDTSGSGVTVVLTEVTRTETTVMGLNPAVNYTFLVTAENDVSSQDSNVNVRSANATARTEEGGMYTVITSDRFMYIYMCTCTFNSTAVTPPYILFRGVTHVVIVACNYPLSAYMNCNSSLW